MGGQVGKGFDEDDVVLVGRLLGHRLRACAEATTTRELYRRHCERQALTTALTTARRAYAYLRPNSSPARAAWTRGVARATKAAKSSTQAIL